MIRTRQPQARRQALGMSLIEVMVAVLVLAVGLLGIAAMQSMALRGGQGSLESSQAVMATNSILESVRANRAQAAAYNMGKTCNVPTGGSTLADADKRAWLTALKDQLGATDKTCGQISGCRADNLTNCKIEVFWDDTRAGGDENRSISVESRI